MKNFYKFSEIVLYNLNISLVKNSNIIYSRVMEKSTSYLQRGQASIKIRQADIFFCKHKMWCENVFVLSKKIQGCRAKDKIDDKTS